MKSIFQDARYCARSLARSPGLATVAILILALALGANTAVFSVMDGVLLQSLPYPEPERVMSVSMLLPPVGSRPSQKEYLDGRRFDAWRARSRATEHIAAYRVQAFTLSQQGRSERLTGALVSPALFPLLRVLPIQGRRFREEERQPGFDRVVLLSYGFWQRRFQGNPAVVGKTVVIEGIPQTIVGVMPRSFSFPDPTVQIWRPWAADGPAKGAKEGVDSQYFPVLARLSAGVTARQAEEEAQAIFRGMSTEGGTADELARGRVRLTPLRDEMVAEIRPALLAMFAAVGLVLLMACINLANLLLARSVSQQREMAIRSAIGASRDRLVGQVLTEAILLSLVGGAGGLLLAAWIHLILPRFLPRDIPRLEEIHFDTRLFLFAFLLAVLTGLLAGLAPALRSSGTDLFQHLQRGAAASPRLRSLKGFVVAQVGLAFVLLVGAGLLLRSYLNLAGVELGFEPRHVLTATFDLDPNRYGTPGRREDFLDGLLNRLSKQPGITASGIVSYPPLSANFSLTGVQVLDQPARRAMVIPQLSSPGYFRAMGLRLSAGRWLTEQDLARRAPVAVVNKIFCRRYLGDGEAVGRRLRLGDLSLDIVGVIEDVRLFGPAKDPKPEIFLSYRQNGKTPTGSPERLTLAVGTEGDPTALAPFLRTAVSALEPDLPVDEMETMEGRLATAMAQPRFYALLLAIFAGMALVLASAGVYGVLSYSVTRQTRAIGVRRALGADRKAIVSAILAQGSLLVIAGILLGTAGSVEATRLLSGLLFLGVTTRDPLSYSAAAVLMLAIGLLACYLPARRASRVAPVEALRYDG